MSAALPSATSMQEAASRPLEYDPKTRATYIRSMIQDTMNRMKNGESEETIRAAVPQFIEQYPELFKKMMKKEDLTPMNDMLRLLDKMGEGALSQHEASVVVGKRLMEKYVTHQLRQ